MMKPALLGAAFLTVPLIASAALPPQYQRQRELEAVITDAAVDEALDGRPIDRVELVEEDVYRVTAGPCSVLASITSDPLPSQPGWAGPRQFHVEVGEATCGDKN